MTGTESASSVEDFLAAWDIASSQYQPAFVAVSALFGLTGAGERPVRMERLAATVCRPVAETRALVDTNHGASDDRVHRTARPAQPFRTHRP